MSISLSIVSTFTRSLLGRLPACVRDLAISWHKNLSNTIDEGDTYDYVKDSIGTRTDDVYYGQYLDVTSGQINFYRTSGTFDYTDPSDGALVEGVTIPGTGLYTVPANGICDIGVNPKTNTIEGLVDWDGINDLVTLSSTPDVTGTKAMSFYLYLTKDSGYVNNALFSFSDASGSNDRCAVYLNGSDIIVSVSSNVNENLYYSISGLSDSVLFIEIDKINNATTSRGNIVDFRINGVSRLGSALGASLSVSGGYIGSINGSAYFLKDAYIWDIDNNNENQWQGQPSGDLDTAWEDTIGSGGDIDGTVSGLPTTTFILTGGDTEVEYTSFYPIAERAGTVLHDIYENSYHISVDTPVWAESLYGSDYLNQQGFIDKVDSDALGYDWETVVNTNPVTLNDNTLVPLAQWGFSPLIDSEGSPIVDSEGDPIYAKDNI